MKTANPSIWSRFTTYYLIHGNGIVNGALGFFSLSGLMDAALPGKSLAKPITAGMLSTDMYVVTASAYDGTTKDIYDAFHMLVEGKGAGWLGVFSGAVKGLNGFVAMYSLMQKLFGPVSIGVSARYALASSFFAVPYWLMETVKITQKLDLLFDRWPETKAEYLALPPHKQFFLFGHYVCAAIPAMFLLAAFALSFNAYGIGQFAVTLALSGLSALAMAFGTTNQYGIKWTNAESIRGSFHAIELDEEMGLVGEECIEAPEAELSPPEGYKTMAHHMATLGTFVKFLLAVISLLSMSEPFHAFDLFEENLNLQGLHELTDHEFDSWKVWLPMLVVSIFMGIGFFGVQLKRLQVKAEQNLTNPLFSTAGFFSSLCGRRLMYQEEQNLAKLGEEIDLDALQPGINGQVMGLSSSVLSG